MAASATRVLVVDDSLTIRTLVELSFEGKDARLEFAANGQEGIAKASSAPPDVILLDFVLPDMKGTDFCRRLAQLRDTSSVPVVIMSSKTAGMTELFKDIHQVAGFIAKPFVPADLLKKVSEARGRLAPAPAAHTNGSNAAKLAPPPAASVPNGAATPKGFAQPPVSPRTNVFAAQTVMAPPTLPNEPDAPGLLFRGPLGALAFDEVIGMGLSLSRSVELRLRTPMRTTYAYLKNGEILLATSTDPQPPPQGRLDLSSVPEAALAAAQQKQKQTGKPALVTLAEQGVLPACDLSLLLSESGRRALVDACIRREGIFEGFERGSFPLYVEAYHSSITLRQLRLELLRAEPMPLTVDGDVVYARAPNFSATLAQIDLTSQERISVQHVDGVLTTSAIATRAGLPLVEAYAALSRLAKIGLITRPQTFADEAPSISRMRRALVFEPDVDGFTNALQRLLGKRAEPYDVIPVTQDPDMLATIRRTKPWLVVVNASVFGDAVTRMARAVVTSGEQKQIRLIAVLEEPSESRSVELARAGFDAVLAKPVSYLDIERVVSL